MMQKLEIGSSSIKQRVGGPMFSLYCSFRVQFHHQQKVWGGTMQSTNKLRWTLKVMESLFSVVGGGGGGQRAGVHKVILWEPQ